MIPSFMIIIVFYYASDFMIFCISAFFDVLVRGFLMNYWELLLHILIWMPVRFGYTDAMQ